ARTSAASLPAPASAPTNPIANGNQVATGANPREVAIAPRNTTITTTSATICRPRSWGSSDRSCEVLIPAGPPWLGWDLGPGHGGESAPAAGAGGDAGRVPAGPG